MHQYLPGGQAQHADHQRHAGEQIQPLGDHAQHRGHHGQNAVPEGGSGEHILLDKQENTDGHNENAHHANQPIQGAQHFRTLLGIRSLGLQSQLGDVGLGTHPLQPGGALAGDQEAAGHEEVSQSLFQLVGLAGEQSFVDQHFAVQNDGVGADLVTCPEEHDVVQHQLLRRNFLNLPLPDDPSPGRVQHGELIQGVLGPNLLDNADEKIGHHQRQEGQVPQRAGGEYQHPQNGENQVKIGEKVGAYDLPQGFGLHRHRGIGPAVFLPLPCLLLGQAFLGGGQNSFRRLRRDEFKILFLHRRSLLLAGSNV